jgi:RNA polymerase sigma-70 factor (ECF subfamily)
MKSQNTKKEFEKFYNTHIDKVYRFVFFRVSGNKDVAQDLVSEIFMKALEHFGDYDKDISTSAWIMTIARNHLANYWRDHRHMTNLPEDEEESSDKFWLTIAVNKFKIEEIKLQLRELLDGLSDADQEIVTFHYLLGYSYAEIAEMKQMTETAIKVAAHRAIKKLSAKF